MSLPPLPQPYLYYAKSDIHGIGVFTSQTIVSGTTLGSFEGVEYSITDFLQKYGRDFQYCYRLGRTNKVLCAKENRNWITYMNDGVYQQPFSRQNVILKKPRRRLCAIRDIQPNEELLLDYGKDYPWKKESLETQI